MHGCGNDYIFVENFEITHEKAEDTTTPIKAIPEQMISVDIISPQLSRFQNLNLEAASLF